MLHKSIVRFGPFTIDTASGELQHLSTPVKLQPTPSKILLLLVSQSGHLVTRSEIRTAIWGQQRLGDFDLILNTYIRKIRAALADTSKTPLFIETVPKRGYRFIGLRADDHPFARGIHPQPPDSEVTVRGGTRRQRNRAESERALIDYAEKLFASCGFAETTTAQVAAAAGCAEGLIHKYFGGKQGLLLAVIRREVSREVIDLSKQPLQAALHDEIIKLMSFEIDHIAQRSEAVKVLLRQALVDSRFAQQMLDRVPYYRAARIEHRLRNYVSDGQLLGEQISVLSDAIVALTFMFGFLRPAFGENRDAQKRVALNIARMLASGVCRQFVRNQNENCGLALP